MDRDSLREYGKYILLAVAIVLVVALIGACSPSAPASAPAPAPAPAAPVQPYVPPVTSGEDAYMGFLASQGLGAVTRETAVSIADTTCELLRTRGPAATIVVMVQAAEGSGITPQQVGTFAAGAATFICPDQKDSLLAYVQSNT
jgi:hypothetical protein